jgi:hypothetical protein
LEGDDTGKKAPKTAKTVGAKRKAEAPLLEKDLQGSGLVEDTLLAPQADAVLQSRRVTRDVVANVLIRTGLDVIEVEGPSKEKNQRVVDNATFDTKVAKGQEAM